MPSISPRIHVAAAMCFALNLSTAQGQFSKDQLANPLNTRCATGLEENKGQVNTTDGRPAPHVRFHVQQGNVQLFIVENGISCQFERIQKPPGYDELRSKTDGDPELMDDLLDLKKQLPIETFRIDMVLEGANPDRSVTTAGRSKDYVNYYNHDALDVHSYERVTFHDVYPGIDWVIHVGTLGIEYDFIVHPGADPQLIRLRYDHQVDIRLNENGDLVRTTSLGHITERRPISVQEDKEIPTAFVLTGDHVQFELGDYDRTRSLTIDPFVAWATYYGGGEYDDAGGCAVDQSGNVYLSGYTDSPTGIADGGHQNTMSGAYYDGFLVKFNADGGREWATYYGGVGFDKARDCAADAEGNVYLMGITASSQGIAHVGFQDTLAGGDDAFLVKFSSTGERIWATYFGGTETEEPYGCAVSSDGEVFLTGYTYSDNGISFNGHQNVFGGTYDAFLAKFGPNGDRIWSTYYGGPAADVSYARIALDNAGNIYWAGLTESDTSIFSGGHQSSLAGNSDAFLAKLTPDGARVWGTYYGGEGTETLGGVGADGLGNVYLSGGTDSENGIAYLGYQNTYTDLSDIFLVRFNANGVREWGTYYGGTGVDFTYGMAASGTGEAYVVGQTSSHLNFAFGGPQTDYGGSIDAFMVKFDPDGGLDWSTYHGGPDVEGARSCAVGGDGNVYLAGKTQSLTGIAVNGFDNFFNGTDDAFMVKINNGFVGVNEPPAFSSNVVNGLSIWPSPIDLSSVHVITIHAAALADHDQADVLIHDLAGHLVYRRRIALSAGQGVLDLNTDLAKGVYAVTLRSGNVSRTQRLVLQ